MAISRRVALPFSLLFLAGCSWHTEALMIGPDTYQVSANAAPARGGITGAIGIALDKANQKCQSMGKQVVVVKQETEYQPWPPNGIANVTFRCE